MSKFSFVLLYVDNPPARNVMPWVHGSYGIALEAGVNPAAHIHIAQKSVNGGIVVWLCQTAAPFLDPTGHAPQCPQSGTVTGTITAANVTAPAAAPGPPNNTQQLKIGDLAEVIAAIRGGVAYANVHTNLSPGGEMRGQIRAASQGDRDDD